MAEKSIRNKLDDLLGEDAERIANLLHFKAGIQAVHMKAYQNAGNEHGILFSLKTQTPAKKLEQQARAALIQAKLSIRSPLGIRTNREANGQLNLTIYGQNDAERETLAALHQVMVRRQKSLMRTVVGKAPGVARRVSKKILSETFR